MCHIIDIVYRFCNCKLDRMTYCIDYSTGALDPNVPHPIIKAGGMEYLNMLCPTCIRIATLRRKYQLGQIGLEEMQRQIAVLESGMVKAF